VLVQLSGPDQNCCAMKITQCSPTPFALAGGSVVQIATPAMGARALGRCRRPA
jgi:hypothetical protein